jgi:uroporphyrin-III C-methyltransferase
MTLLPVWIRLERRPVLVVGAGTVALAKIESLRPTGAKITVVAPATAPQFHELVENGDVTWHRRTFDPSDLDGIFLVVAATNDSAINRAVYEEALRRNILCNAVDDPPNCDFYFGSVVTRGDLQIAISTAGESPAVAQRLRREIDEQLPEDLGPWLENLGQLRREVLKIHPRSEARKALLHQLAQRQVCESQSCPSRQMAFAPLDREQTNPYTLSPNPCLYDSQREQSRSGKVYLVGAGPGDPELLTIKASRVIQHADVVLHDDLVPQAILENASPRAEIVNVGKRCGLKSITQEEINALMIEHARSGRSVVRLKSGDPLIFGRAAEEMAALNDAGVAFEIVPGITAAFAAAAAIQCSLTDRNSASNVIFSTGHHAQSHNQSPLPEIEDATRVVYMPGRDLTLLAAQWLDEGLPPDFPCVVVSRAAQPDQEVRCTTLAALGEAEPALAPSLLIAGWAVRETTATALAAHYGIQVTA